MVENVILGNLFRSRLMISEVVGPLLLFSQCKLIASLSGVGLVICKVS